MSFQSVLKTVETDASLAINAVIKFVPKVASLVEVLFPSIAPETAAVSATTVTVATMIQNAVLAIEAKYASATAGATTNAQKLADVLAIVEAPAIALLKTIGVTFDTVQITNIVNAVVAIFKNTAVTESLSPATVVATTNAVTAADGASNSPVTGTTV